MPCARVAGIGGSVNGWSALRLGPRRGGRVAGDRGLGAGNRQSCANLAAGRPVTQLAAAVGILRHSATGRVVEVVPEEVDAILRVEPVWEMKGMRTECMSSCRARNPGAEKARARVAPFGPKMG